MHKKYLFFVGVVVLLLSACASSKLENANKEVAYDSTYNYAITNTFLKAKRQLYQGNRPAAIRGFVACTKQNPKHDASYYELARIYEYANTELAIEEIKKAINIAPENKWYREFLIRIYQQQKAYKNAIVEMKILIKQYPNKKEYYYQWANLCINDKDYKQALEAYNKLLDTFGYEEGVLQQIKQIYLKEGKFEKAIVILKKLIQHQPDNKDYYGMVAEIYSSLGKPAKAMEYYNYILQKYPNDGFVHFALADYYRTLGQKEKFLKQLKLGMKAPNTAVNSKMKVLINFLDMSKKDSSYLPYFDTLLSIAINSKPMSPKIMALKADYCMQRGEIREAINYLRMVNSMDSSKYIMWEQLLLAEEIEGDYKSMLNESERALRLFPQQPKLYYFNAKALGKEGHWAKAKERIMMGSNFVFRKIDKATFLAFRAKAEMQLGEYDDAMANYRSALKMDNDNALILKDFAFALASHNLEFEKALGYAKRALELKADNPDYIYVYAYCLFKNNQKELALKWLKPTLKNFPANKNLQLLDMEINKDE